MDCFGCLRRTVNRCLLNRDDAVGHCVDNNFCIAASLNRGGLAVGALDFDQKPEQDDAKDWP